MSEPAAWMSVLSFQTVVVIALHFSGLVHSEYQILITNKRRGRLLVLQYRIQDSPWTVNGRHNAWSVGAT